MKHINIIANNIGFLCSCIIAELNKIDATSNIREFVFNCISSYKKYIGLEKFYISKHDEEWNRSFYVELSFVERPNVIKILFENNEREGKPNFQAIVENTLLFVDQPLSYYIKGIAFCGFSHNYLYVDQFTKMAPIRPKQLSYPQIVYGNHKNMIDVSRESILSFYENISEVEQNNIKIINIDAGEFYAKEPYFDINRIIEIYAPNTTCVIVPHCISRKTIDKLTLNSDAIIVNNVKGIPEVTKSLWIKMMLKFIESSFLEDYTNPGYYNSIIDLIMDHKLSGEFVSECLLNITTEENLKRRRLLDKIKSLSSNYIFNKNQ